MTFPTIRPALTLDFQKSRKLDPRITFSRSSSATYLDPATGLIKTAPDGVARFEKEGLLIEEARTNSLEWSEDVSNAYWTQQECSLGATTTAPDGTNSAYLVIPSTTDTNLHRLRISTGALNQQRSQSCYAKAGGYNYVFFRSQNTDVVFDLSTGLANNPNGEMIPIGNGWYRCIYTGSAFLGSRISFGVSPLSDGTGAGNGTDGVYLWGLQWEDLATFPTSYIATAGSQVTRAADVASITGTNFSSWYNQNQGAVLSTFKSPVPSGTTRYWMLITDGANSLSDGYRFAMSRVMAVTSSGGNAWSSTGDWLSTGYTQNAENRTAFGYDRVNDSNSFINNGAIQETNTSATDVSIAPTTITIGAAATQDNFTGHISRLAFYPERVSDESLEAITS